MKEFIIDNRKRLIIGISAGTAAILLAAFAIWFFFTPYMLVSLDVNPSIEYSVSHANRVLSATAVNDDGSEILDGLNLQNKSIDDAIKETVQKISDNGYFDGDDPGAIQITTSDTTGSSTDQADALAQKLQDSVQAVTEDEGKTVEVEAESVTPDFVQQAKAMGISPGKLNLIQKLQASSADPESITVEDYANRPVKDIMKSINENKKAEKANGQNGNGNTASTTKSTAEDSEDTAATGSNSSKANADNNASKSNGANGSGSANNSNTNANATKNSPNDNANSNATKNWKYTNSTTATTNNGENQVRSTVQSTVQSTVTAMETSRVQNTQTTHSQSDLTKPVNDNSNGKGKN